MLPLKNPQLFRREGFIDGRWIAASDKQRFPVTDPASGEELAQVADMNRAETRAAIEAAQRAQLKWRETTAGQRASLLRRWCQLILENEDDLALIMTAEQGKPLAEARGEIRYGASFFEWFAEECRRVYGDVIPAHQEGLRNLVIKQPVGVVAAITPWNFPMAMMAKKLPAALAAGCGVVWKPAEETPLSALALAVLGERAGLPPGLLNVVTSSDAAAVGEELTGSPLVRKISFTGSVEVGKLLMRQSAATLKKVSLELGGNAPFIVFDDADLNAAVEGAVASKFRNAGQTCVCANRILVQERVYDAFAEKLKEAVGKLRVGPGRQEKVDTGPLINEAAVHKVEYLIADACRRGAKVIQGGKRHLLGGTFFEPTILTEVCFEAEMAREEIFGPVAPLYRFADEEQAIRYANDTRYGLAAYFYSREMGRIWRVSEALEYGMVGVNTGMISTAVAPFGGVKESGLGREGGKYGIDEYLEVKYICMGGIAPH